MPSVRLLLALALVYGTTGCAPADFWESYESEQIVDSSSDQGPWGGRRWVQWSAEGGGFFGMSDVVTFAEENGWECDEASEVTIDEVASWVMADTPIFPMVYGINHLNSLELPRHVAADAFVIECDTDWVRVDPGTGASRPAYGFILLSRNGAKLAVYHHWGEG